MNLGLLPPSIAKTAKDQAKTDLKLSVKQMLMESMKKGIDQQDINNNNRWNQASIANYLRNKGYDYTLSVFLAESDVSPEKMLHKSHNIRLFDKNPDSNKMLLQVWEKLEQKYNDLLKQRVDDMETDVASQVRQVEGVLRQKIHEEEAKLKKLYGRKIDQLEEKEREMQEIFHRRQQNAENEIEVERKEILRQIREVDFRRRELGSVEIQLGKQIESEMKNLRQMRENLTNFESQLRRRELEVNLILEQTARKIREEEQNKYKEKLREFKQKEENLRRILENAKYSNDQYEALQFLLKERDSKILGLEAKIEQQKRENEQLIQQLLISNEKLKEISHNSQNYTIQENTSLLKQIDALNEQLHVKNVEQKNLERQYQNEIKQLKLELTSANSLILGDEIEMRNNLNKKIENLRLEMQEGNEDWKKKVSDQKLRYEEMKKHYQFENDRNRQLVNELNKLKKKKFKDQILKRPETSRTILNTKEKSPSDDESSLDSPPDFVKDAQNRLKQLEEEAKNFDTMLNKYRMKEINASAYVLRSVSGLQNNYQFVDNSSQNHYSNGSVNQNENLPYEEEKVPAPKTVERKVTAPTKVETKIQQQSNKSEEVGIPKPPTEITIQKPPEPQPVSDADDWEARLKAREEERRKRDEEFFRKQREELDKLQKAEPIVSNVEPVVPNVSETKNIEPAAPAVDPVMQKYMEMVLEQKRQQQTQKEETKNKPAAEQQLPPSRTEVKDDDIEVASLERPSSSEFEW